MAVRTPRELIEIYWERVYNAGEVELVRDVCADPIIRHDPGVVIPLSHDEQIVRIKRSLAINPLFTHRVLHADDRFVTSVWNMVSRDGRGIELCGIEVFEAEDGRFTRCWNSSYTKGLWGEDGDEFDPAALPPPMLVATPAEITADWLHRALAHGGAVPVQRIVMPPEVTPIGHGTTSATAHLRMVYNDGHITAPRSAIIKIGRAAAGQLGTVSPFEREQRAYALFGKAPPFRVPRCYFSGTDQSGLSNLLLEDLSGTARAGDQIAGCSIAEASAVVRELARFHAAWWGDAEVLALDWLSQPERLLPAYAKGVAVVQSWPELGLSAGELAAVERFGTLAERWLALTPARRTLIHCDARVDNVLFEDTAEGLHACLIDWQNPSSGDPQYDVAYFLSGSVSVADRRACERELVAQHAKAIAEVEPGYTVEEALEAYRCNVVSGLWLTVIAAAYVERTAHNAALIAALLHRNVAAIADWQAFDTLA